MSLFKTREWWSTTSGFEEFHDFGCLCVANIDNRPASNDKIVVGSFQGLIRIYEPHPPTFSPSDVVLEKQLSQPVIQLAAGPFLHGSTLLHLATLHPHLLSVYSVVMETTNELEPTYNLVLNFSHQLKRTAFNMICGQFGNTGDVLMCVQSMDGQLSFFHHESAMFACFLPDFLIPGPLSYIPVTDSFVTVNAAHMLQVFKYQSLSVVGVASEQATPATTSGGNTGKKVSPDWVMNLGEHVLQIQVVSAPSGPHHILVLGERSLFCLTHGGVVRFTKKLDFNPSCLFAYHVSASEESPGVVRTLISSHSNQLLVLQDSTLIWAAAMMGNIPVQLTTANFQAQSGIIVSLSEQGHLTCSYLGTDPTVFSAPQSTARDVSFEDMERELAALNQVVKQTAKEGVVVGNVDLKLWAVVQDDQVRLLELDEESSAQEEESGAGEEGGQKPVKKCLEVKVHVESGGGPSILDVTLSISAALPLTTHPSHFVIPEVSSTHSCREMVVTVVCTPSLLPTTTSLSLSASYRTCDGSQQVVNCEVDLPLHLFCEPAYPEKTSTYKVTIDATPCEPILSKLFPPQLLFSQAPPQAIGVRYLCGPVVTVVASKGTQRYRLQSNSFPALATALNWLLGVLGEHFKKQNVTFAASYASPLPLNEYFEIIDRHFKLRRNLEQCREWLGRHAHQLRSIQKRLLTRFKDKTPVGLAHLDTLLDGTYMQLMALSDKNELLELELQECSNQLSCGTILITTLLRLCSKMSEEDFAILNSALTPAVSCDGGQGWEELVDAAVTHLLRTSLAKSSKDQQQTSSFPSLEMPTESYKLKKHIALLCDRISKGFLPSGKKPVEATQSLTTNTNAAQEDSASFSVEDTSASRSGTGGYRKHPLVTQSRQPSMPVLPEQSSEDLVP